MKQGKVEKLNKIIANIGKQGTISTTLSKNNGIIAKVDNSYKANGVVEDSQGAIADVEYFKQSEFVQKRLSLYPPTEISPKKLGRMSLYVDDGGQSRRVSMRQIKDLNTKIHTVNNVISVEDGYKDDYIFSKE